MIEQMLDALADFQAQADLLEMDKRRLLDEVKIPDEVIAAQDEANAKRRKLESDAQRIREEIREVEQKLLDEIVDPEMPPEFVAALAAARQQREDVRNQAISRYHQLDKKLAEQQAELDASLQGNIKAVYAQVAQRKADIQSEFSDKAAGVLDNIAKLTAEIKQAVKDAGHTVKGQFYQAVYVKGRVSWNTDMLDGMIAVIPQLAKARKEGEPSVTLRKV